MTALDEYIAPALRPRAAEAAVALAREPDPTSGGFAAVFGRVQASTLVLWGREDRWIPVEDPGRFASALPHAKAVVLDRCGHVPQEECPAEVARLMRDFLAVSAAQALTPPRTPSPPAD